MQENQKAIDKEIDSYMNEDTSIRKNYNLLTSIPGIGRIIALETIVLTENFTAISNPRKYACYIGIAPFKKESGTSVRKKTGVSKKGFSEAKADLSIAVLSAIRNNPSIRDYWIRKRKEKCGGIVLNAIKFKLVLRMFAVIKRGTPYVETDAYKN
jgi:transposase